MRAFACDHCGSLVFFENTVCVNCQSALAFVPNIMRIVAFLPSAEQDGLWHPLTEEMAHTVGAQRVCKNRFCEGTACNFTTEADGSYEYCVSCRQTRFRPDFDNPQNLLRANKAETAKRYLFYTLSRLSLSILEGTPAPVFDLLEEIPGGPAVLTGHASGVITLNVAEADDDERARRRLAMFEPYRTLLGHLRHESGHFFWDILIQDTEWLEPCRQLFGDERMDYGQALRDHYARGHMGIPNWQADYISTYATSHPWEDWAETWAHYMHVMDLLETASNYCLQISLPGHREQSTTMHDPFISDSTPFSELWQEGVPLTLMLNSLNRSLGHNDAYPFTLSPGVITKLSFIHDVVNAHRRAL